MQRGSWNELTLPPPLAFSIPRPWWTWEPSSTSTASCRKPKPITSERLIWSPMTPSPSPTCASCGTSWRNRACGPWAPDLPPPTTAPPRGLQLGWNKEDVRVLPPILLGKDEKVSGRLLLQSDLRGSRDLHPPLGSRLPSGALPHSGRRSEGKYLDSEGLSSKHLTGTTLLFLLVFFFFSFRSTALKLEAR